MTLRAGVGAVAAPTTPCLLHPRQASQESGFSYPSEDREEGELQGPVSTDTI
jgi:hypothetical protein